ncbi:MAG: capsular polysaccharide biosynthesis protein [Oscillospiraceae bacterium]|nr:capsular polysaccharide biosynthesis protein [Oscillospiraceae bacterium]
MIDFHSHILPGIDDGSRDTAASLLMLNTLKNQGADTVCATSHFYATQRSVEHFLFYRQRAWQKLETALPSDAPRILLGAEVLYFPGISRMHELSKLCLEGTNILLLEMPFEPWTAHCTQEVRELARSGDVRILLAHIERYFYYQPISVWDEFLDLGILMQANAEFFLPFRTRRKALKLLEDGYIHLLGSDAHNMSSRAPRLDEARSRILRSLGEDYLVYIDSLGSSLLPPS